MAEPESLSKSIDQGIVDLLGLGYPQVGDSRWLQTRDLAAAILVKHTTRYERSDERGLQAGLVLAPAGEGQQRVLVQFNDSGRDDPARTLSLAIVFDDGQSPMDSIGAFGYRGSTNIAFLNSSLAANKRTYPAVHAEFENGTLRVDFESMRGAIASSREGLRLGAFIALAGSYAVDQTRTDKYKSQGDEPQAPDVPLLTD